MYAVGDQGKPAQLQYVEVIAKDDSTLSNYHALLDELLCVLVTFVLQEALSRSLIHCIVLLHDLRSKFSEKMA